MLTTDKVVVFHAVLDEMFSHGKRSSGPKRIERVQPIPHSKRYLEENLSTSLRRPEATPINQTRNTMANEAPSETGKALEAIWHKVHSPSGLTFPLTVQALQKLHVTRYRVDYVSSTVTAYITSLPVSPDTETTTLFSTLPIPTRVDLRSSPIPWEAEKLVAAIRSAQAGEGNYISFSTKAVEAGVTDYTTYIKGRKVVYSGALGESHTELFPSGK
jgi:hypothetical protein